MPRLMISLSVRFDSPPSVGAGGTRGTLADKTVTRDARGRFILPASQVKGKLRHACEQILRAQSVPLCRPPRPEAMCPQPGVPDPCLACRIFGSPAEPSRLRFHDLLIADLPDSDAPGETLRTMVSLNRQRRAAQERRLFLVETAPHVPALTFSCSEAVTGFLADERHAHLLVAGLKMLFAWGGGSSRGLGWGSVGEPVVTLEDKPIALRRDALEALIREAGGS